MGIYENAPIVSDRKRLDDGKTETWIETFKSSSGYTAVSLVTRVEQSRIYETCFCCSCYEDYVGHVSNDVYCRNHGFAGTRPCELHGTPGQRGDDDAMPESVQVKRAKDAAALDAWLER